MVSFREARDSLLIAYSSNLISYEEFAILYDLNTSKNLVFLFESMISLTWT